MGCVWSSVIPRVTNARPHSENDDTESVGSSEGCMSPESSILLQNLEYGDRVQWI